MSLNEWIGDAATLLGKPVQTLTPIRGGRNSQAFKVECADQTAYFMKAYSKSVRNLSRLEVEYKALSFLWSQGMRNIAQPIACDAQKEIGIYSFSHGQKIQPQAVSESDIWDLIQFLEKLRALSRLPEALTLPDAAEACLCFETVESNIQQRLSRLLGLESATPEFLAMQDFLRSEYAPALATITSECHAFAASQGIPFNEALSTGLRTLSPSDIGFHNILREDNHRLKFVDFEYFGWDDPAKMLSDFLLQPDMQVAPELQRFFLERVLSCFEDDRELPKRFRIAYPLFAMKWCLILLNEFLRENMERRLFADRQSASKEGLLALQLEKAGKMLVRATSTNPFDPL